MNTKALFSRIVRAAINEVLDRGGTVTANSVSDAVPAVIDQIPEAKNELNQEPLSKSRVVIGSVIALLSAGILILNQYLQFGFFIWEYDWDAIMAYVAQAGIVAGPLFALYGRIKSGLKPFQWFGLAKE